MIPPATRTTVSCRSRAIRDERGRPALRSARRTNANAASIGSAAYPIHARIDDVRVYNRALTLQEVAGLASGVPSDTDGDGLPDYSEDRNGNSTVDSGETNWQDANDAGLRVWITRPPRTGPVP